jgi:hypothetical protein
LSFNAEQHRRAARNPIERRLSNSAAMASVSSLDKDMRKLRMDKYTPAAAKEARDWIEDVLRERLSSGDLLEALKDGTALCKYD